MKEFDFPEESEWEKLHREDEKEFIEKHLHLTDIKDIGDTPEGIRDKIDFEGLLNGKKVYVEVKLVKRKYPRICLEYMNSNLNVRPNETQPNKPGWMSSSKADVLCYLFNENGKTSGNAYDFKKLRRWYWLTRLQHKWEKSTSLNKTRRGERYNTHCDLVPLTDIPNDIILSEANLATFKPKRKLKKKKIAIA